jgi:phage terminase large subunit-like protein
MDKVKPWPPAWLADCDEEAKNLGKGQLAIDFIEAFGVITKDSVAGKSGTPMVLRDWQKELVRYLYAGDGRGGFKQKVSLVGMARKSGKSALASSLAVFDLYFGPRGGEVYSIAAEKNQAAIVFKDAKKIIEANPELMELAKLYRDAIEIPKTGSIYRVLSAEAFSKEGLSPTAVWGDEIHAMPNRELWDVMSLAMAARGSLAHMVGITTAGVKTDSTGQDSIAYTLYQYGQKVARKELSDSSFGFAWWEAPQEADHRDPEIWPSANPGFGDISDPEDFESAVRRTPEPEFRTKRMNQWVSSAISWLPTGAWDTCAGDTTVVGKDYVLGLDGSFSGDATIVTYATIEEVPQVGIVGAWEKDVQIHDDTWRVDVLEVEETIRQFVKANPNVKEIACDPYRWTRTMQVLQDEGYPIVEYPSTNARRMVPACSKFYDAVVDGKMIHDGNPLLARHLDNAVVKIDNLGPRIVKENRASQRRIDAAVAAVLAFDRATASRIEEEPLVPQFFA